MRREHARGHHGGDEIRFRTAPRRQEARKPEALHRGEHGVPVPMRQRLDDLELGDRDQRLVVQCAPNQIDDVRRQVGQVADRLIAHLRAVAIAAAQQVRLIDLAFVVARCRDDVDRTSTPRHG